MKIRSPFFLPSLLLLAGAQFSLAAPLCPPPGWAEGLASNFLPPAAPFPTKDTANLPTPDCSFHEWSWEAFVWATAIDPDTKVARFLTMPTEGDFGQARTKAVRASNLILKPRTLKPQGTQQEADSFEQAGPGGVVVDKNGQALFYAVHMNDTYFKFAQQYYGVEAYQKAAPTQNFPVGAAVFKSSWQIVPDAANPPAGFYITAATVPILVNNPKGGVMTNPSGATRKVTVAFIGLHVVGVTENHPEFLWGTFEQVNNSPFLADPTAPNSPSPVSGKNFTLYQAGTAAKDCNQLKPKPSIANPATQTLKPITNVFLQYQYGGADAENQAGITSINGQAQSYVRKMKGQEVFANYTLVGTAWQRPNILQPGDGNLVNTSIGSTSLANSTMETFVQGTTHNCFMCHNTAGFSSNQIPGKNINISHVILGPLFNSPAAKAKKAAALK